MYSCDRFHRKKLSFCSNSTISSIAASKIASICELSIFDGLTPLIQTPLSRTAAAGVEDETDGLGGGDGATGRGEGDEGRGGGAFEPGGDLEPARAGRGGGAFARAGRWGAHTALFRALVSPPKETEPGSTEGDSRPNDAEPPRERPAWQKKSLMCLRHLLETLICNGADSSTKLSNMSLPRDIQRGFLEISAWIFRNFSVDF